MAVDFLTNEDIFKIKSPEKKNVFHAYFKPANL